MTAQVDRLGTTVGGKYRIAKFLAAGGMGAVYEALHVLVKRRFAVKFLRADLAQRRDALLRFQREAEAAGALENENIAAVFDFGIASDGAPYIVMEYLVGLDLARLLSAGPLPPARASDLVIQACRGIHDAHTAGVIHRDLKPENLFVCRRSDGSDLVKIVDFGIAKLQASDANSAVTRTGAMVGTPAYMSPEQARGDPTTDQRTDVYALGVILYELLSGKTPHPGDSYNAVIYHISTQPPVPLAGEALPPGLADVVHRALSPSPDERCATAEELARELMPFARREVWPIVVDRSERVEGSNAASFPGSPLDRPDIARHPHRRRTPGRVAAALTGLGLALVVVWWIRRPLLRQNAVLDGAATVVAPAIVPAPSTRASVVEAAAPSVSAHASQGSTPGEVVAAIPTPAAGRPPAARGRPRQSVAGEKLPAAPNSAPSQAARTTFDTKNPYE